MAGPDDGVVVEDVEACPAPPLLERCCGTKPLVATVLGERWLNAEVARGDGWGTELEGEEAAEDGYLLDVRAAMTDGFTE